MFYKAHNDKDLKVVDYLNYLATEVLNARSVMYQQFAFPQYDYTKTKLTVYVGHKEFYAIMAIDRGDSTCPIQTMEGDFIWFDCPLVRVMKESYLNIAPQYTRWKLP